MKDWKEKGFNEFLDILRETHIYDVGHYSFVYQNENQFLVTYDDKNNHFKATMNRKYLEEFIDECDDLRYSTYSGNLMADGMTNLWNFYCREDEFESYMNELYGEGQWHVLPDGLEDEEGGYYVYIETNKDGKIIEEPTGIFYTDWYDSLSMEEIKFLLQEYQEKTERGADKNTMEVSKIKERV